MTPADARKSDNQTKLQNKYALINNECSSFSGPNFLSVGDHVRISAYKYIFDKKYKKN